MATKTIVTEKPVVLDGFQAVMKPGKYGTYKMEVLFNDELINQLESERANLIKWCESKLKNPKRSTLRPEPWEEVSAGAFKVKFTWEPEDRYFTGIFDSEGTKVIDENTPIYSGSTVKVAFFQKPYVLKDGITYGTSLKLQGIQVVSLATSAGVDSGDMAAEDVAALFGTTKGFKADDPNVTPAPAADSDDDF